MQGGKKNQLPEVVNRRMFLKTATAASFVSFPVGAGAGHTEPNHNHKLENVVKEYFRALPDEKEKRNAAVVQCANRLCSTKEAIAEETIEAVAEKGERVDRALIRAKFGARALTELNLTSAIDESMIVAGRQTVDEYTKYLPLLGSFNNLRAASCAVNADNPESIKRFLFAALTFGVEVTLWSIGAPYQMAWKGTRFVSNRTFLRLAKHGCQSCVALAMSELHWAIRGSVYAADEVASENRLEFVVQETKRVEDYANGLQDETGYEVELTVREDQIKRQLDEVGSEVEGVGGPLGPTSSGSKGPLDGLLPDLSDFKLPEL